MPDKVVPTADRPDLRGLIPLVSSIAFPDGPRYGQLAAPWNVSVPSRPLAVIEAADAAEIARTLEFATANGVPVAVQCTGHGAMDDLEGALLVLTGGLAECVVHPETRWVRVGAGLTWQPVLDAAGAHGLAALAGSSPGVGVVGYTTGGGVGPLARTLGIASDRVRAFEVVTGDGELRRASADEHPDLFWGLRGGKGALGVVTAVEFDLLPIREIYGGALYFDGGHAADLLALWADWCAVLPPEATTSIAFMQLPSMPGVPEPLADRLTVAVRFAWTGDPDAGRDVLAPIRGFASPLIDGVGQIPYPALGSIHADPVDPMPSHEHGGLLGSLPPGAIEAILGMAGPGSGSPQLVVEIRQLGGAIAAPDAPSSAFPSRDAAFSLFLVGLAVPPLIDAVRGHAAAVTAALEPWLTGMVMPNFAPGSSAERFRRVYDPATLQRLASLSHTYDPAGILVAGRGLRG
jgi:hypothetical protein